jgi:molybdate transport system regulatory protein
MLKPTVRFRIDFSRDEAVGPGKISLLEHIAATGSLSRAARSLNMSYRRAWRLVEGLNVAFADPVTVMSTGGRGGGGATLTAFGRTLIEAYRSFEKEIQQRAERHFQPIACLARPATARPPLVRRVPLSNRARSL